MDGPGYLWSAQAYHLIHHQMNMALKNKSLVWWDWIWESGGSSRRLDNQKTRILSSDEEVDARPSTESWQNSYTLLDGCCTLWRFLGMLLRAVSSWWEKRPWPSWWFFPTCWLWTRAIFAAQHTHPRWMRNWTSLMRTQRLKTGRRKWCRWLSPCRGQSRTRGWRLLPRRWWRSRCDRHRQERQTALRSWQNG